MENFILIVHVIIAVIIIGLIMIQQGKGAEAGASFGSGSSQTVFGAAGTGNLFSKLTAIFVAIFFVTSFSLAVIAKKSASVDDDFLTPTVEAITAPAAEDELELPEPASERVDDASAALEVEPSTEQATKPVEIELEEGAPAK